MNSKIVALGFFTCLLLSMTSAGRVFLPRCRCLTIQEKPIRQERIQKFVTIAPGPHCKNVEVIATIKFKKEFETCVNINDKWVQDAMKKMGHKISEDRKSLV